MYLGPLCNLPSCLFGNTRDTSVMYEKAIFVCFIYMQPLKVKLRSFQINLKLVSYIVQKDNREHHKLYDMTTDYIF